MRRPARCALLLLVPSPAFAAEPVGEGTALSLLAPLVAVGMALATRRVIPSLLVACAVAALVLTGFRPDAGLLALLAQLAEVLSDPDNLQVTAFTVLMAAMVGVVTRSGGTSALVARVQGIARGPRGAVVASWLGGLIVFFDDYANCLVVGNAMGPLYDRYRISRAKLAYVVDSTAAPIASMAIVSTWVGFEVERIDAGLQAVGSDLSAFGLFLDSIPFRFYSIYTLFFVGLIAWTGRDFGPMVDAERHAARHPRHVPEPVTSRTSAWVAAAPILLLVGTTFGWLVHDGRRALGAEAADARLFEVLGAADAYDAILMGSALSLLLACALSLPALRLGLPRALWSGVQPVLDALVVLFLAWTLGDLVLATGAREFLSALLESRLDPALLPTVTFLVAAAMSFATGSSFSTMGILVPIVVPLALGFEAVPGPVVLGTTGAVLAGACLGDHASPISDTTVLSSLGSGVDLVTHVRTQLPYALTTGAVAVLFGTLPCGYGVSPWLVMPAGALACWLVIRALGTRSPGWEPEARASEAR